MRIYCIDCANWDQGRHYFRHGNKETDGCTVVTSENPDHPIKRQTIFLNYAEANKDGTCKHYVDKAEGLGMVKDVNKNRIEFDKDDDEKVDET